MGCSNSIKNCHYKSCQTAYSDTAQVIAATGTTVNVLGSLATDTGVSISTDTDGFNILTTGLYRISYDVDFAADAAGTVELALYKNGVRLPCVRAERVTADGITYPIHGETIIRIPVCCANSAKITAQLTGVAGSVTHVCANIIKEA